MALEAIPTTYKDQVLLKTGIIFRTIVGLCDLKGVFKGTFAVVSTDWCTDDIEDIIPNQRMTEMIEASLIHNWILVGCQSDHTLKSTVSFRDRSL